MKILLTTPFFPPEIGSAAHLYYEFGQAMGSRGHDVTVLTGLPRYHAAAVSAWLRETPPPWPGPSYDFPGTRAGMAQNPGSISGRTIRFSRREEGD